MSYNEYKYDAMGKSIYRDPKSDSNSLEDVPYIELILNPCCAWLRQNNNWAKLLMEKSIGIKVEHLVTKYHLVFSKNVRIGICI